MGFKLLSWIFSLALGAVLVLFLFANRQMVAISLDPSSVTSPAIASPALPLWVWLMTFLLIGFFLGAGGMWMSGKTKRDKARRDREAVTALTRENQVLAARATNEAPLIVADS